MKKIILLLLACYSRYLSPLFPAHCRFYPTCSSYTRQAIERYGLLKGLCLGLKRIGKCHPWHEGGIDYVPEKTSFQQTPNTEIL